MLLLHFCQLYHHFQFFYELVVIAGITGGTEFQPAICCPDFKLG